MTLLCRHHPALHHITDKVSVSFSARCAPQFVFDAEAFFAVAAAQSEDALRLAAARRRHSADDRVRVALAVAFAVREHDLIAVRQLLLFFLHGSVVLISEKPTTATATMTIIVKISAASSKVMSVK